MTAWLPSVRLATTASLTPDAFGSPRTPATLDGVTVVVGDHILVKDQTNPIQNGTWVATSPPTTAMTRRADTFEPESTVRVSEGDRNRHTQWTLRAPAGAISVGADPLRWLRQDVKNYSFETLAALKDLTTALDNATASLAGYYAPGDDGGGDFSFIGAPPEVSVTAAAAHSVALTAVSVVDGTATFTTSAAHGFVTAQSVFVTDAGDATGAWVITVADATHFSVNGTVASAALGGAARVSYVSLAVSHDRPPGGQRLAVSGVVASGGAAEINQTWNLGAVYDATTLSLPVATSGGTYTPGACAVVGDDALRVTATDASGAVGGIWKRTITAPMSVRWFGAVGDGAVDDLAAIRAAVVAAKTLPGAGDSIGSFVAGSVLRLPPGVYRCAGQLVIDGSVVLQGTNGSGNTSSSVLVFDENLDVGALVLFRHTAIDGSGTNGTNAGLRALGVIQPLSSLRNSTIDVRGVSIQANGVRRTCGSITSRGPVSRSTRRPTRICGRSEDTAASRAVTSTESMRMVAIRTPGPNRGSSISPTVDHGASSSRLSSVTAGTPFTPPETAPGSTPARHPTGATAAARSRPRTCGAPARRSQT